MMFLLAMMAFLALCECLETESLLRMWARLTFFGLALLASLELMHLI